MLTQTEECLGFKQQKIRSWAVSAVIKWEEPLPKTSVSPAENVAQKGFRGEWWGTDQTFKMFALDSQDTVVTTTVNNSTFSTPAGSASCSECLECSRWKGIQGHALDHPVTERSWDTWSYVGISWITPGRLQKAQVPGAFRQSTTSTEH